MKKSDALKHFKTQASIARALTEAGYPISQPAVSKWGELVPEVPARILAERADGHLEFAEKDYRKTSAA